MKRFALLASLLMMWVLMLNGCGSSGGVHVTTGGITVVNAFSTDVVALYIWQSSASDAGPNRLTAAIPSGGAVTIPEILPGTYYVAGATSNGSAFVVADVTVTVGATTSVNTPTTGSIQLTNNTSNTIMYLYISPASSSSWGPDQLGSHVIQPGQSYRVNSIPAGKYDVKAVTSTNVALYAYNVEVIGGAVKLLQASSSKLTPSTETVPEKSDAGGAEGAVTFVPPAEGQGEPKE